MVLSIVNSVLDTGTMMTNTPLTQTEDTFLLKQIAVNALIHAGVGALFGRHVCNLTYQQGAFLGATVILTKATIGAFCNDNIPYMSHNGQLYGNAIGFFGATFGLTYLKEPTLPNFRQNVIYAAAIQVLTKMITKAIADKTSLKSKI